MADPLRDFRNFLFLSFRALGKTPSRVQYDVADFLQSAGSRIGITGHRGLGKSYITSIFAAWCLYCNPDTTIICVSGNQLRAAEFIRLTRQVIEAVPELHHLRPNETDRDGAFRFDCGARTVASKDPSVAAYGITSMIVGAHADVIIPDDVETPLNSETIEARDKLFHLVGEFESVLNPGGRIVVLGTPHNRDSLYNRLAEIGYTFRRWPARYPDPNDIAGIKFLSPMLMADLLDSRARSGDPTHPERFDHNSLVEREAKIGPTAFSMQFMLSTDLADADRYPLKLRNFIVMPITGSVVPARVVWGTSPISDIPAVGLRGDNFNAPIFYDKERWVDFESSVMFIDPAGDGADETAYAVAKLASGMIYVTATGGMHGGPTEANFLALANIAKMHGVRRFLIEKNYGGGAWARSFQMVASRHLGACEVEDIPSGNRQKELRIIDTLEPVLAQHRLVIDPEVARDRVLMLQVTGITRSRNSLSHEDRLEALSGAVAAFTETLVIDTSRASDALDAKERDEAVREMIASRNRGKTGRTLVKDSPEYVAASKGEQQHAGWGGSKRFFKRRK